MKTSYINFAGQKYSLTENIVTDKEEILIAEQKIRKKAEELSNDTNLDVFYCLKTFDDINIGWKKAYFFLIPIERWEVEQIKQEFHKNNQIGIFYNENSNKYDPPFKPEKTGYDFEQECARYLELNDFEGIEITKASGDQGIDIIAWKAGKKYGIQCKYYKGSVGNKAVQEAFAGSKYYNCDVAVVMSTGKFTSSAVELANQINVLLWKFER